MKVTKEHVQLAIATFWEHPGNGVESMAVALQDFVDRNHLVSLPPADLQPGAVTELGKFEPVRDYRKEMYIAHWASLPGGTRLEDAIASTKIAVEEFDKFFGGAQ